MNLKTSDHIAQFTAILRAMASWVVAAGRCFSSVARTEAEDDVASKVVAVQTCHTGKQRKLQLDHVGVGRVERYGVVKLNSQVLKNLNR